MNWFTRLYCLFMGLMLLLVVAKGIYDLRYGVDRIIDKPWASIVRGPDKGRGGRVVSYWPFDLLVTLNMTPTDEAKAKKRAENLAKFPDEPEWAADNAEHFREWRTEWRWNVQWTE